MTKFSAAFKQNCESAVPSLLGTVDWLAKNTGVLGDDDYNGVVNSSDKNLLQTILQIGAAQYATGFRTCDLKAFDVNGDGKLNTSDLTLYP